MQMLKSVHDLCNSTLHNMTCSGLECQRLETCKTVTWSRLWLNTLKRDLRWFPVTSVSCLSQNKSTNKTSVSYMELSMLLRGLEQISMLQNWLCLSCSLASSIHCGKWQDDWHNNCHYIAFRVRFSELLPRTSCLNPCLLVCLVGVWSDFDDWWPMKLGGRLAHVPPTITLNICWWSRSR